MPFLEEVNEQRRRVEDRRKNDRRTSLPAVEVASYYEPAALEVHKPKPSLSSGPRITSHVSNQEIDKRLNDFLDRLLEKAEQKTKLLSDAEALAGLATESTLMLANSKPCWLTTDETEQVKAKGAGASE
jgi:Lon protease-like protein